MPLKELPETDGPLAKRKDALGRRQLTLTKDERKELQESRLIDRLVLLYLDLDRKYTQDEIAEKLEITRGQLNNLIRTKEFEDRWNEHFIELGRDPRIKATQASIAELLPAAFSTLKEAVEEGDVPWTVRIKAVEKIFELAGIERPQTVDSNRKEFEEFMKKKQDEAGKAENIVISIPSAYAESLQKYQKVNEDIIEGEAREVDPTSD